MVLLLSLAIAQDIDKLLERLDSDDIESREAAVVELSRKGAEARAALLPRRDSTDQERARTARRIIGRIDWEPYLAYHARPNREDVWERLGSGSSSDFLPAFDKIVQSSGYSLGFARKFQDTTDETLKKLMLPYAGRARKDPQQLQRWALALPDAALRFRYGELIDHLAFFFGAEEITLDLPFWQGLLRSPVKPRRYLAARILGQRRIPEGLDGLLEFVGDADSWVADRAILILRNAKHRRARAAFLAEALRENGHLNAFYALFDPGEVLDIDELHRLAALGDPRRSDLAHRELAKIGDRSRLPALLERLEGDDFWLLFDGGYVQAVLHYDTKEAVEAVLAHLARVERLGANRFESRFRFGPNGARLLWERFVRECREGVENERTTLYLGAYVQPEALLEHVRQGLRGEAPKRMRDFCRETLRCWLIDHEPTAEDLELLRLHGWEGGLDYHLLKRQDPVYLQSLRDRLRERPDPAILYRLQLCAAPALASCFLEYARADSPELRAVAIYGIGKYPCREAAGAVADAVDSDHPRVRDAAFTTLDAFPPALLRGHEVRLEQGFRRWAESSGRYSVLRFLDARRAATLAREAIPKLRPERDPVSQYFAALLRAPEPDDLLAVRRQIERLGADSPREVLELLARLAPNEALDRVRRGLEHPGDQIRALSCDILGLIGGNEAARLLEHVAWTEGSTAAIRALARIGGPGVAAFARRCSAEAARSGLAPESWPIAASHEQLPIIARLVEHSPEPFSLRAMDRLLHRTAYENVSSPLPGTQRFSKFEDACRALAGAVGLDVEISEELISASRREAIGRETIEGKFDIEVQDRLEATLDAWNPEIRSWTFSSWGGVGHSSVLAWSPLLTGRHIAFLTPKEARDRLLSEWKARPR